MNGWIEPEGVQKIETRAEFDAFFALLTSAPRKPVLVVSIPEWATSPEVDVAELVRQLEDSVDLYVLPPHATFWLTDALAGKSLSVHSGWVRVYPSTPEWRGNPARAPNFRPSASNRRQTVQRIVDASLEASFEDGGLEVTSNASSGERASVKVVSIPSAVQALVETEDRRQAIMRPSHLVSGVPARRVVAIGQRFSGRFTPVGLMGEFVPDPVVDNPAARAIEFVGEGVTTSVLVSAVSSDRVALKLHPDVAIAVTSMPGEDLSELATKGEVVTAEVILLDGEFVATFSDEDPSPSMSILPGGPVWIEPAPHLADRPGVADAVATDGATSHQEDGSEKSAEVEALINEKERLSDELEESKDTISKLRRDLRQSRKLSIPVLYREAERQFRFEVKLNYLIRVDESIRSSFPWPEKFVLGDPFLDSVDELVRSGGIAREKIIDVCADVLCGRAKEISSRGLKEWKVSASGPQLTRADGAVAMRARLQTSTASARRMRYWVLRSGEVELDWVGVHDEGI